MLVIVSLIETVHGFPSRNCLNTRILPSVVLSLELLCLLFDVGDYLFLRVAVMIREFEIQVSRIRDIIISHNSLGTFLRRP